MNVATSLPLAVRLGFVHVSVGPVGEDWAAVAWSPATRGPALVGSKGSYESAVDRARGYVAVDPARRVLDLPDGFGEVAGRSLVHVERRDDGRLEVLHESASGNSYATLRLYDGPERKRALMFAVDVLPQYGNPKGASRLGRVAV